MKVDESNYEILKKVSEITLTDYEIKWFNAENIDGYIESDNLFYMIEDLLYELNHLEEEFEDLKQDIQDNYKPIPVAEQVGISDKDFM